MSFPYSYSVLGLVPGLIVTVVVAMSVLYTSLIVWYVIFAKSQALKRCSTLLQGILSSPPRTPRRLRCGSNALLRMDMGLVLYCSYVSSQ